MAMILQKQKSPSSLSYKDEELNLRGTTLVSITAHSKSIRNDC